MLKILKRVRGAVADKNLVQALTHFFVYKGRIQGSNGRMAIDSEIPGLDGYSLTVPADQFVKAVDSCEAEPVIKVTEKNVIVSEGGLRVRLPILANDAFPRTEPDPMDWEVDGTPLLPALAAIRPFIATDASKAWSIGAYVDEGHVYATNNVVLVRHPLDFFAGTGYALNLPGYIIDEILRAGEEPIGFGVRDADGGQSITFYFDGWWLKAYCIISPWPMVIVNNLFAEFNRKKIKTVPAGLKQAVEKVLPFCPDPKFPIIKFSDGGVQTDDGVYSAEVTGFKLPTVHFNGEMLKLVLGKATHSLFRDEAQSHFLAKELEGLFVCIRRQKDEVA